MRRFILSGVFSLCLWVIYPTVVRADECTQRLTQAEKAYETGQFNQVINLLESCLTSGSGTFPLSDKVQAHRLVILSYIFTDRQKEANDVLSALLHLEPDYAPDAALNEPREYLKLLASWRTSPVAFGGMGFGLISARPEPFGSHSISSLDGQQVNYTPGYSWHAGLSGGIRLTDHWSLLASPGLAQTTFSVRKELQGFSQVSMTERQLRVEMPVQVQYRFRNRARLNRPFLGLGISPQYLLSSNGTLVREATVTNERGVSGPAINLSDLRRQWNYALVGSAGLMHKIPSGFVYLNVSYAWGMQNQVRADHRYANSEMVYRYGYIDDDFRLHSLTVTLGYWYAIYKPKKLKHNTFGQQP